MHTAQWPLRRSDTALVKGQVQYNRRQKARIHAPPVSRAAVLLSSVSKIDSLAGRDALRLVLLL